MANVKLIELANFVETSPNFDQNWADKCVVALGLELAKIVPTVEDNDIELFATFYGITYIQAEALYWAEYDRLFDDEIAELNGDVTRERAAGILRRLANEGD